ncbi:MAG TPA: ABC transporter substrate-binding protein [Candidatus Limnocylindria bacterium]|nr:ABC transporter substrate-binding protein [Candidatus Limnocylindria bacterium]
MALRARRILLPLIGTLLLAACQTAGTGSPAPASPASQPASAQPPTTTYPLTLTDDAGNEVTLPADPQRIVSLAPSNTEIACAVDACDELVGVTDFDDHPAEVAEVEDVVIGAQVDVEKVVAAEPDLVLAAGNGITPDDVIAQLTDQGLTVLVLYPETLDEIYADIELVGEALDEQQAAADEVARMEEEVAAVTEAVAGADAPRVFYEVGLFEGQIYTAGEDSFLASLIELAGGEPITGDAVTTSIGQEELVAADPEVILLGDAAYDPSITPQSVAARPGWAEMTAVKESRIVVMTDDLVITRPGPRVTLGLAALARAIHPELFNR